MEILIINRVPTGAAIGWSFYDPDENHDFYELTIHLILVDIAFRW